MLAHRANENASFSYEILSRTDYKSTVPSWFLPREYLAVLVATPTVTDTTMMVRQQQAAAATDWITTMIFHHRYCQHHHHCSLPPAPLPPLSPPPSAYPSLIAQQWCTTTSIRCSSEHHASTHVHEADTKNVHAHTHPSKLRARVWLCMCGIGTRTEIVTELSWRCGFVTSVLTTDLHTSKKKIWGREIAE